MKSYQCTLPTSTGISETNPTRAPKAGPRPLERLRNADSVSDKRSHLQQENDPLFAFLCHDDRHAVHRPCCFASDGHVLPQYVCHGRFSGTRISAFLHECDVFLCVGSEKRRKLFLDLVSPSPTLSPGINEMYIP